MPLVTWSSLDILPCRMWFPGRLRPTLCFFYRLALRIGLSSGDLVVLVDRSDFFKRVFYWNRTSFHGVAIEALTVDDAGLEPQVSYT